MEEHAERWVQAWCGGCGDLFAEVPYEGPDQKLTFKAAFRDHQVDCPDPGDYDGVTVEVS